FLTNPIILVLIWLIFLGELELWVRDSASARGGCQFRYPYRRGGQYELYSENTYTDLIEPEPPEFVSETFESLCHQAVPALYTDYQLRQVPSQWWYKSREVDVVAPTDESTLIAGKAKFTTTPFLIP
ncbi:DUF234 domain-containing protein, partial [Halorubrum sp. FL23]|uniref:DUF234 domain-containing protein n=1 Tax=Halorubrum sp. FL23 TaxID=3458704 RepID=UPI0040334CE4